MPGQTLISDGFLSPTVGLQQLSAKSWFLPLKPASLAGRRAGSAVIECSTHQEGPATSAPPGRRNHRLGDPQGLSFSAGEWFRAVSPIEPLAVRVVIFGAQKMVQGAELAGALTRYF